MMFRKTPWGTFQAIPTITRICLELQHCSGEDFFGGGEQSESSHLLHPLDGTTKERVCSKNVEQLKPLLCKMKKFLKGLGIMLYSEVGHKHAYIVKFSHVVT